MNIFTDQPEFIDLDPRTKRPASWGYEVTKEFMFARHKALIPPELIKNKRVLDLGSCLGATGAWCLSNGAQFYKGIEIDDEFVKNSTICLKKYYPIETWSIEKSSIEDFFQVNKESYDVLIASGILYGSEDAINLLRSFAECADFLIIESMQSRSIFDSRILSVETKKALSKDPRIVEFLEAESYIAVGERAMVTSGNKSITFPGFNPSMGAIKFIMTQLGFRVNTKPNQELRRSLAEHYAPLKRFALYFEREASSTSRKFGLKNAVKDKKNIISNSNW